MTLLPIVDRELRVAARQRATYWSRFFAACLIIVVSVWMMLAMWSQPSATVAKALFGTQSAMLFIYCLGAGRLPIVSVKRREKERSDSCS